MKEQNHIDKQVRNLLNAGIDGELSSTEQDELNKLLAASEKVRELDSDLRKITGLLDGLTEHEAPEYLQGAIKSQVRLPLQGHQTGPKRGLLNAWLTAYWLRTAFALTAGVLLTVGIYQIGSDFPADENTSGMTGTIVQNSEALQGSLLDKVEFKSAVLHSSIELRDQNGQLHLDVRIDSVGAIALNINFGDRGLDYEGLEKIQSQGIAITVEKKSVYISSTGEQHYVLMLSCTSATHGRQALPLELEFFAENKLVHKTEMEIMQ